MHKIIWSILLLLRLLLVSQPDDVFEADLIFDRQEGDTWIVYAADLDQLITQPILTRVGHFGCPFISPDARYLAYHGTARASDDSPQYTIYIYDFATQTTQTVGPFDYYSLRDGGISCRKVWSPDSEWLMFHSSHQNIDFGWDEYIVRADGADVRRLTENIGEDFLAWGADSQSVYLVKNYTTAYRVDLATMERTEIFESEYDSFAYLQFSPDDVQLYVAYMDSWKGIPFYTIEQINLSTDTRDVLFEDVENRDQRGWVWSLDGSIGAISLGKTVYVLQDGELWQVVYETPEVIQNSVWLPDNRTLIMLYGDTDPWLVTVEVEQGTFDEIDFLRHGSQPQVTPDGEWIVFLREHPDGYEIYRMHSDGSDIAPLPDAVIKLSDWWQKGPSVLPVSLEMTINR